MWSFYDPAAGNALLAMRDSREMNVIGEALGKNRKGVAVCDCWKACGRNRKQRCRARIIAEVSNIARRNPESGEAARACEALRESCGIGMWTSGEKERRLALRDQLRKRARRLTDKCRGGHAPGGFAGKLGRAYGGPLRFATCQRVAPANDAAGHGLREIAARRKARGAVRSKDTGERLGSLFACATARQNRGPDFSACVAACL